MLQPYRQLTVNFIFSTEKVEFFFFFNKYSEKEMKEILRGNLNAREKMLFLTKTYETLFG